MIFTHTNVIKQKYFFILPSEKGRKKLERELEKGINPLQSFNSGNSKHQYFIRKDSDGFYYVARDRGIMRRCYLDAQEIKEFLLKQGYIGKEHTN